MPAVEADVEGAANRLLVMLFRAAATATSAGREFKVSPFPLVVDEVEGAKPLLDPEHPDYDACARLAEEIHDGDDKKAGDGSRGLSPAAQRLVNWVIHSNQSRLVALPEAQQIQCMGTTQQYIVVATSPEHEKSFSAHKKAEGASVWGFHGSAFDRWHSILRNGLTILRRDNPLFHSAAHGEGIYFSPSFGVAMGYSRANSPDSYSLVALCEVLPSAKINTAHPDYCFAVKDGKSVVPRFLFVYSPNDTPPFKENITVSKELLDQVQSTMRFYQLD